MGNAMEPTEGVYKQIPFTEEVWERVRERARGNDRIPSREVTAIVRAVLDGKLVPAAGVAMV